MKEQKTKTGKLSPVKIAFGSVFFILFLLTQIFFANKWETFDWQNSIVQIVVILELGLALYNFLPQKKSKINNDLSQNPVEKRKFSKRTLIAAVMVLIAIPITIYIGMYFFGDKKYYFISLLIIFEILLPFLLIFESRKPQARELIIVSVLCAIAVAGRSAFFMIPQFKPVVAIVIIAGVCFGGETGFLVGAITAFVSNMFFMQGPWTPWQMFSFGIIGFLAGVFFKKGLLKKTKGSLCIFGGLATFFLYGVIMNTSSALMSQAEPSVSMFAQTYLMGMPMDLVHATSTVFFLWFISTPMIEKLDRIKTKYGISEE